MRLGRLPVTDSNFGAARWSHRCHCDVNSCLHGGLIVWVKIKAKLEEAIMMECDDLRLAAAFKVT